MKKILLLTTVLTLISLSSFAQNRAALIGITKLKSEITYNDANQHPECYFEESINYNDSLVFSMMKNKVDSLATIFGFIMIPEDSVINAEPYKGRVIKMKKQAKYGPIPGQSPRIQANGYGNIIETGLGGINDKDIFFSIPAKPDVVMDIEYKFDVRNITYLGVQTLSLSATIYVSAHTLKKKMFLMRTTYDDKTNIPITPVYKSCWGNEIVIDISNLQLEVIKQALIQLDDKIKGAEEDIAKYYEKEAQKEAKKESKKK